MRRGLAVLIGVAVAFGATLGGVSPAAASHEIVIGLQCDRTGATQTVGVNWCPGYHDYVALVNSKGGVEGRKIKVIEIDHEYKVPPAMEASGGLLFSEAAVRNIIPNLRLILFGTLIIFFLVVEPEGLNRLWRNIRNYFRIWPFAY